MSGRRKVLLVVAAGLSTLWLTALPAAAHTRLVASDPSDGATIARMPTALVLTFNEPPLPLGTKVVVTGPSGQVQTGRPEFIDNRVRQALQPGAPAGNYDVVWRVSSGDGHPVSGRLRFAVQAAGSERSSVGPSPTTNSQIPSPLPPLQQQGSGSSGYPVLWVTAGLIALAALAYWLLRQPLRLRRASDGQ